MKKYIYSILFILVLIACEEEDERLLFLSDANNRASTFYRFDDALADTVIVSEGSSKVIRIETPLKPGSGNVDLEITVSGPAADIVESEVAFSNVTTISGGTEGNINQLEVNGLVLNATIENSDTVASLPIDIKVEVADNEVTGSTKFITLTLTSATLGTTALGLGDHTGAKRTIVLAITDDDCESQLAGTYSSENCYPDPKVDAIWAEDPTKNGRYNVTDITGGYYAFAGLSSISAVMLDKCGNLSIESPRVFSSGTTPVIRITATGKINADGSILINWTDELGYGNGGTPYQCSTVFMPQ